MTSFLRQYGAYLAILGLGALVQILAVAFDAFERIYALSRAHEAYELDELFMLCVTGSVTFGALAVAYGARLKSEVARRRVAERRSTMLARNDPLTGLSNRRSFNDGLARRIREADGALYAFLIDLDRFKPINDVRGHAAGDRVLQTVADRLRAIRPEGALIARLGGDEFALVADWRSDARGQATRLAQTVVDALAAPIALDDGSVEISASVGVAALRPGMSADALIQCADHAMYKAKEAGRNAFALFDEGLDQRLRERSQLQADIRRALREGEFEPFFQPLIALDGGAIRGFEILARWRHPERGLIGPAAFIPIAEEMGLVDALSWRVLRRACAEAAAWRDPSLTLAFNLAPTQLGDRALAAKVLSVLEETGFPGSRLEIEVTESAIIRDHETARALIDRLKAAGVRVALDDFGVGYSSITNLHTLPFDMVKIDRSFVTNGAEDPRREQIVQAILGLAHGLGLIATAEGVETARDLDWLKGMGCDLAQGFYFARPMPAGEVAWYLDGEAERGDAEQGEAPRGPAAGRDDRRAG